MAVNLNRPPLSRGPLLAHEMRRDKPRPAGCDQQGRCETRQWPDTVPTGWGEDKPLPTPRVVPCSTVARLWLALKRWLS